MGRMYWGPYADQVGNHEGYAARELPDGTLTAVWTAETAECVAQIAACDCGWYGTTRHSATEDGDEAALEDWHRLHLQPLIAVARAGWPVWATRVAERARAVAEHIANDRPDRAALLIERLAEDVDTWRRTARELADG
jgi:hypothetical protein